MILIQAAKLVDLSKEEEKIREAHFEDLAATAENMLRAGVTITTQDYANMLEVEKDAFMEGQARIRAEMAFMTACAIGNPEYQKFLAEAAFGKEGSKAFEKGRALGKLQNLLEKVMAT